MNKISEEIYNKYLVSLLAGNRLECCIIIQNLLDTSIEITDLHENLIKRSMYEVGNLWELNEITVANEHLATAISDTLLNLTYPYIFETKRKGKKAVIACCTNELHQLGAKMVGDILELNGWDSSFLGANTPLDDMISYIDKIVPKIVGLSLSYRPNLDHLKRTVERVRSEFPNLNLMIGGHAFLEGGLDGPGFIREYSGVEYVPSLKHFENILKGECI
ncbi:MAG: cobalamin-dependent protein [Desulforhopalus sp.]